MESNCRTDNNQLMLFSKKMNLCSNEVVIFGLGARCKNYIKELKNDLIIKYIIDNDSSKIGTNFEGIEVISLDKYIFENYKYKILISTNFNEIALQLIHKGFQEEDFCDLYKFIQAWFWEKERKIYMFQACFAITTKCSLNCRDCGMFIPYYKEKKHRNLKQIKEDLDAFFKVVDKLYVLELLGGEPFLNYDLGEILDYIFKLYGSKIGKVVIFTNGTVIPKNEVIEKIKLYDKIEIFISDYTKHVMYKNRLDETRKIFDTYNISYTVNDRKWFDLGITNNNIGLIENYNEHMMKCEVTSKGIYNKRIYYCHILWSAVESGILDNRLDDSFNIENLENENSKIKFIEYSWGLINKECLSLCKKCNGFGRNNHKKIAAGIQIENSILKIEE